MHYPIFILALLLWLDPVISCAGEDNRDRALSQQFGSHKPDVRQEAVTRIGQRYGDPAGPIYRSTFPHEEVLARERMVPSTIVERLCYRTTNDPVIAVRFACVRALHQMLVRTNIWPILKSLLNCGDPGLEDYLVQVVANSAFSFATNRYHDPAFGLAVNEAAK